jgi:MFS family permease
MISAHTTAFSWQAAGNAIGAMSGSAIGGFLSEPYGRVPLLSGIKYLQAKPYITPGIVLLGLSVIASVIVMTVIPEVCEPTDTTDSRPIPATESKLQ